MSLFDHLDDRLFDPLTDDLAAAPAALAELERLAAVDHYADLSRSDDSAGQLRDALSHLEGLIRHQHQTDEPAAGWAGVSHSVRRAWMRAWLAATRFPSCGETTNARASIPLGTLALFDVQPPVAPEQQAATAVALAQALGLEPIELGELTGEQAGWDIAIATRRAQVAALVDGWFRDGDDWDLAAVAGLINACHPGLDLMPAEVGVIDVGTAVYLVVPDDAAAASDTPARRDFTKRLARFRFERFNHFPMFSHLDLGEADAATRRRLAEVLGCPEADAVGIANRCLMLERAGHLDSYLVHDSWGHIWQALLTDYDMAYDHVSQLQHPLGADLAVADPIHRWLTLDDCLRPDGQGGLTIEPGLIDRLGDGLIRDWLRQLTVPVIAELTADCVEFCLRMDHPDALVSSSVVADRPCKVDLALADLAYFVRQLGKGLDLVQRRPSARAALRDRLVVLTAGRWSESGLKLDARTAACDVLVDQIIDRLVRRREQVWQPSSETTALADGVVVSDLTRVLLNVLRLHTAVNDCYLALPAHAADHLPAVRSLPLLYVAQRCREHPDAFWSCDEEVADTALPFVALAERVARDVAASS